MKRPNLAAIATAVASLVLAVGLVACGDEESDSGLVIGNSVPLTGDLADFGPPGEKAAEIAISELEAAIDETNADLSSDLKSVELVTVDNETNPQAAVQAARSAVADGASCLAGAWASADTIPTARSVAIQDEILQITPASTADEISTLEDNGFLNRTAPPDRFQGPTLANAIAAELGGAQGKTVSVGARNDAYGNGLAKTFTQAWEELGGQLTREPVIYDPTQPSYDSEAQDIVAGNPDAYVIIDFPETFVKVGPALARTGDFDPSKTYVTDGLVSGDLTEDPGPDVVSGIRGSAPGAPDDDPASKAFGTLFEESEPTDVERQVFDAQNFDAVVLCYLSAVAADSTDGADMAEVVRDVSAPGGQKFTWQQLPQAIEALAAGKDIDYQGASGPIDMDENGDATAGVYDIYQFKGAEAELVPIDEVNVVTG